MLARCPSDSLYRCSGAAVLFVLPTATQIASMSDGHGSSTACKLTFSPVGVRRRVRDTGGAGEQRMLPQCADTGVGGVHGARGSLHHTALAPARPRGGRPGGVLWRPGRPDEVTIPGRATHLLLAACLDLPGHRCFGSAAHSFWMSRAATPRGSASA